MKSCGYADGGMVDLAEKRKKRLKDILGAAHYALGGMAEDAEAQMNEMNLGEDDFLSDEDKSSEIEPEDIKTKRKARLFSLITPKFIKK